ncbi:hypothetical protein [Endozoicomonas sp.]|uniref:hypothetical protein n=1 Tax=Endozoicomonas sp. TaxID=1892382 RepID=UPI00383B24FD
MNKLTNTQKNLIKKYAHTGFIPLSAFTKNKKTINALEKFKMVKMAGKDEDQVCGFVE